MDCSAVVHPSPLKQLARGVVNYLGAILQIPLILFVIPTHS